MLKLLQPFFHLIGIELVRRKKGYVYAPDFFFPEHLGRASHKRDNIRQSKLVNIRENQPFGALAEAVIEPQKTLLYYDRLYTIYQAVSNLKPPAAGMALDLAEVGVYKGGTSHFILAALESLGLRPATLHCFDTFEGHSSGKFIPGVSRIQRLASQARPSRLFTWMSISTSRRYSPSDSSIPAWLMGGSSSWMTSLPSPARGSSKR